MRIGASVEGADIRTVQDLLGHEDVKTTEIYAHAVKLGNEKGVRSPLDGLGRQAGVGGGGWEGRGGAGGLSRAEVLREVREGDGRIDW